MKNCDSGTVANERLDRLFHVFRIVGAVASILAALYIVIHIPEWGRAIFCDAPHKPTLAQRVWRIEQDQEHGVNWDVVIGINKRVEKLEAGAVMKPTPKPTPTPKFQAQNVIIGSTFYSTVPPTPSYCCR